MKTSRPLDNLADVNVPKETLPDGKQQINLSKDTHKGENHAREVYERETGRDFCD